MGYAAPLLNIVNLLMEVIIGEPYLPPSTGEDPMTGEPAMKTALLPTSPSPAAAASAGSSSARLASPAASNSPDSIALSSSEPRLHGEWKYAFLHSNMVLGSGQFLSICIAKSAIRLLDFQAKK